MSKKKIGVWIDKDVADGLDALSDRFDGLKGEIVAASIWMFVNASPQQQAEALKSALGMKVDRFLNLSPEAQAKPTPQAEPALDTAGTITPGGAMRRRPKAASERDRSGGFDEGKGKK
jgi:hypothetical protein